MKIPRENTTRTRVKLLAAAVEIFAENGYPDTTIAAICRQAGTNVAAVNYHFGSKEALYREAWRYAFSQSIQAHPPDGGVAADAPPEERLQGQITALLRSISDENNRWFWFMQREFANPTGLLEEVMREAMMPLRLRTQSVVREFLGQQVAERDVRFCEIGIISQCINPMVVRSRLREKGDEQDVPPRIYDIEAYTRHVLIFSLAGIKAIRAAAEASRRSRKTKLPRKGQ